jgi:hypothetical protein
VVDRQAAQMPRAGSGALRPGERAGHRGTKGVRIGSGRRSGRSATARTARTVPRLVIVTARASVRSVRRRMGGARSANAVSATAPTVRPAGIDGHSVTEPRAPRRVIVRSDRRQASVPAMATVASARSARSGRGRPSVVRTVIVGTVLRLVSVVRTVIDPAAVTVASDGRSTTGRRGPRRASVPSAPRRLVSVVRSATVPTVRAAANGAPSVTVPRRVPVPRRVIVVRRRATAVPGRASARSARRLASAARSVSAPTVPCAMSGAPTATAPRATHIGRSAIVPRPVTAARHEIVPSVRRSATVRRVHPARIAVRSVHRAPIAVRRMHGGRARPPSAVAIGRPRDMATVRSVQRRSATHVTRAARGTTCDRAVPRRRNASRRRRSPRTCCSRTWTARCGNVCGR